MAGLIDKIYEKMAKKVEADLAEMEKRMTVQIKRIEDKVDILVEDNAKK